MRPMVHAKYEAVVAPMEAPEYESTTASTKHLTAWQPSRLYRHGGKRLVDIVASTLGLAVLAPLFLSVWFVLRVTLGPGVILRQERIGLDGCGFWMLKFRTMDACRRGSTKSRFLGEDRRKSHKSVGDPRHTRLGRLIRKFSLDELPQLFNVLRGDMSIVGPRPELAAVASPGFRSHIRHSVRPGLTGPFQISDLRSSGQLSTGLNLDDDYVRSLRLRTDLRLLTKTTEALARGTGS